MHAITPWLITVRRNCQLRRGGWEHSSALALGCCVGVAGGGSSRRAAGELAPVGAFVVGSESAGGEHGGGGGVDAGDEESLVLGPGGAVGVGAGGRPLVGCVLGGGAHRVAWEVRQAGQASWPRSGEERWPAGWPCGQGVPRISCHW